MLEHGTTPWFLIAMMFAYAGITWSLVGVLHWRGRRRDSAKSVASAYGQSFSHLRRM